MSRCPSAARYDFTTARYEHVAFVDHVCQLHSVAIQHSQCGAHSSGLLTRSVDGSYLRSLLRLRKFVDENNHIYIRLFFFCKIREYLSSLFFFFNDPAPTEISPFPLHAPLPI